MNIQELNQGEISTIAGGISWQAVGNWGGTVVGAVAGSLTMSKLACSWMLGYGSINTQIYHSHARMAGFFAIPVIVTGVLLITLGFRVAGTCLGKMVEDYIDPLL